MEDVNLIHKIAHSYHLTTGIDQEELFQEAALAYLMSQKDHNPLRGKPSTHAWHCMSNHLRDFLRREKRYYSTIQLDDLPTDREYNLYPIFELMSAQAEEVAKIVLDDPDKYIQGRELAKKSIRKILREKKWSTRKINKVFAELQRVFL